MTTLAATTVHVTHCHHADFGGGSVDGRCPLVKTSDQWFFTGDNADTMAASVALLERFQQPGAVTSASQSLQTMAADGGDQNPLLHRGRQYNNQTRIYRPRRNTKYNSVSAGSALSKSMQYADGWLYEKNAPTTCGTVDGRSYKTRSTFLGHEHFRTASAVAMTAATITASTLPVSEDPYNHVRKNRMASSLTTISVGKSDKKRDRSGLSRTPSPDYDDRADVTISSSRRSILECTVNPYDLLRQESDEDHEDNNDDNVNGINKKPKRMSLKDKFMHRIQDTVFTKNRTSIGGFNSFSNSSTKKAITTDKNIGGVNIAGHTVRYIAFLRKYLKNGRHNI